MRIKTAIFRAPADSLRVRLPACFSLVLLGLALAGCSRTPHTINLMPAPAAFADEALGTLPVGEPPVDYDDFRMLYATDRNKPADPDERPFYYNRAGFVLRLGQARVSAGLPGIQWEQARRISLSPKRSQEYPLQVVSVEETGSLAQTDTFLDPLTDDTPRPPGDGRVFAHLVDQRLASSGVREIYVYVHGYRVVFDIPVLVAAELWHFLGYRGAFIAYTWPSTPHFLAYGADVETAIHMARKLRLFLTYLAENTQAERIHLIGFSAGSRLVVRALEQLALQNAGASKAQIRQRVRIGNVIIVGGDVSRKGFAVAVADGLLRIPERVTIYVSSTDRALIWARRIFRHPRLGQMFGPDVDARTRNFLRRHTSLELVDVTLAAGSSTGNGHSYFSRSPWVSSDLLALLAFDLKAGQRGLVPKENLPVWSFPPDYVARLQESIKSLYSGPAAGHGKHLQTAPASR